MSTLVACGDQNTDAADGVNAEEGGSDSQLTIYSGRSEGRIGELVPQLEEAIGIPVEVRYGSSAEMAAQLLAEGDRTEADLFFSQDAGALGALSEAGMLAEIPDEVTEAAPERFLANDRTWIGTSARARVIVYNPDEVDEADVPDTIDELVDERWRGEVGYDPTNASFQAFVTGLRIIEGEQGAREWLTEFDGNDPQTFGSNGAILDAVNDGVVAMGLVNHTYATG
ncbi:extracellular solute-binding protein [Saccharomonospora sp. CUA-673]|uniref:extracellular solute-binding protein n=1 Tax=Saccharomonospora sp. CUA-673 TaxID=1904969 RepID=UPI001301548E|nr:extracellular solute-binding protein [Saccharomonospora sp. CUA-673]